MTQEVPLSLQVFHSSNEYKAHRMNRTEQVRLDDVRAVLEREEKLYVKEYVIHKNKFNSHHRSAFSYTANGRRNSLASSSVFIPPRTPQLSRANSGCYTTHAYSRGTPVAITQRNHNNNNNNNSGFKSTNPVLNSALASQLCMSLNRLSTSTRFQRIQRQFSLASFTQNGLLTRKGKVMAKDIPKARNILFKGKSPVIPQNCDTNTDGSTLQPQRECESAVVGGRTSNDKNTVHTTGGTHSPRDDINTHNCEDKVTELETTSAKQSTVEISAKLDLVKEDSGVMRMSTPLVAVEEENVRILSFPMGNVCLPGPDGLHPGVSYDGQSSPQGPPPKTPKKKVTIKKEVDVHTGNAVHRLSPICTGSDLGDGEEEEEVADWGSFFSRPSTAPRPDPLQERINSFLADQDAFNRAFPKSSDSTPEIGDLQTELAVRALARKEMKKRENKKKNEIVCEVLQTLGVDDPHIIAHYDI